MYGSSPGLYQESTRSRCSVYESLWLEGLEYTVRCQLRVVGVVV